MLGKNPWIYFQKDKKGDLRVHIIQQSKDQTLPKGSRESLTWIILRTILCLVLDFQTSLDGLHHLDFRLFDAENVKLPSTYSPENMVGT